MILQLFFSGDPCDYTDTDELTQCDTAGANLFCNLAGVCAVCDGTGGTYVDTGNVDENPTCTCLAGYGGEDCATELPAAGKLFLY